MAADYTEQQSPADIQRSKELSLERTRPPTEVPGYQAERFIGSGAYGEVWAGLDRNTGRKVAIKFYAHRRGVDWSLLSREVEKLVFLSADRYVVQLLEVGWDADPPYYVMEYIEQGSLDDLLRRDGTFSVPDAVELFREIAVGLAHAHGKGVLHCDLKPANILLDQDQRPRLADFGQSRLSHEQKPALGTLFYMAPEQADLEAVPDVRWDVYALGAILYTLLVGAPPHRTDETVEKIESASDLSDRLARYRHAIRTNPPPAEHRRIPGMDRALADIIDRLLAVNPEDRFANVQEVLDALAARDRNHRRLPLMVLGFVGPLLVLLITGIFSFLAYARAVKTATDGNADLVLRSNQITARLAAEKMTGQLRGYFETARKEAEYPAFRTAFFEVADKSQALADLVDPATPDSALEGAREAFLKEAARLSLQNHLRSRLDKYQEQAQLSLQSPKFASIFVTDRDGTQLAAAFDDGTTSKSLGWNVALRPYFSGESVAGEQLPRPPTHVTHIDRTHLSAVFFSTSQETWKVAVSTPIYRDPVNLKEFEGVLVLTVGLADFQVTSAELSVGSEEFREQFLVLVDGKGDDAGTILHHPLFDELKKKGRRIPDALMSSDAQQPSASEDRAKYRVAPTLLAAGQGAKDAAYNDPVGNIDDPLFLRYKRQWLAAAAPVMPPADAAEKSESGLVVIVQSDFKAAVKPAEDLGNHFLNSSFWMLVVLATVGVALWYIVVRTFREPTARLNRVATPDPESTPLHSLTTLAAPRKGN